MAYSVVLETDRLIVRHWLPQDLNLLHAIMSDPSVMRYVWGYQPASEEQIREFIDKCVQEAGDRVWTTWPLVLKENDSLIGYCGFLVRDHGEYKGETEMGWLLAREHWGKGLATEAAKAIMEHGIAKWRFKRIIASARAENSQSLRVMEKIGMHRVADSSNNKGRLVPHAVIENQL